MCKIGIVGWSSTRKDAPYMDKSWDIWIMNQRIDLFPRYDLHFDLHNLSQCYGEEYLEFIIRNKDKSVLTGLDERFKEATVYPKDEIIKKYSDFFTCSMSWMIAYAIEQNPTDIGLWGVDLVDRDEYVQQRPSVLYMLGIAKGKGINLHYPENCKLFRKNHLYWDL